MTKIAEFFRIWWGRMFYYTKVSDKLEISNFTHLHAFYTKIYKLFPFFFYYIKISSSLRNNPIVQFLKQFVVKNFFEPKQTKIFLFCR